MKPIRFFLLLLLFWPLSVLATTTCIVNGKEVGALQKQDGIFVLNLYGNYHDMGYCYGKLVAHDLEQLYLKLEHGINFDATLNKIFLFAEKHTLPSREKMLLQGIASGSGMSYDDVIRLNFSTDLLFIGKHKPACSVVGINKHDSATGHVIVGRNYDLPTRFAKIYMPYTAIVAYHPEQNHAVAIVSPLGMVGGLSAINDVGLFNEINSAINIFPFPRINPVALPNPMIQNVEALFDANSLSDLYKFYQRHLAPVAVFIGIADADMVYHFERSPFQVAKALQINQYDQVFTQVLEQHDDIFTNTSKLSWLFKVGGHDLHHDYASQAYLRLSNLQKLVAFQTAKITVPMLQNIMTKPLVEGGAFQADGHVDTTGYSLVVAPSDKKIWLYVFGVTQHWVAFQL